MTIAVDLDGTLAFYEGWKGGEIGPPVPIMVERVKKWLENGESVVIFTARVAVTPGLFSQESQREANQEFADAQVLLIKEWCKVHIGQELPVTAIKDFTITEFWDDRAVQVVPNTGQRVDEIHTHIYNVA